MSSLFDRATPHADGYRDLAPAMPAATSPKPRLVDVREPDEYVGELGHVEGAELVPRRADRLNGAALAIVRS